MVLARECRAVKFYFAVFAKKDRFRPKTKQILINKKTPFYFTSKNTIDLKASLVELANNLTRKHQQFRNEIDLAQKEMGCDFVVLVREPLANLEAVRRWSSNRTKVTGEQLYKIMKTMWTGNAHFALLVITLSAYSQRSRRVQHL